MLNLEYKKAGDYLIPDLEPDEAEEMPIGRYGRLREQYLEQKGDWTLETLLLEGRLQSHLKEIDGTARGYEDQLMEALLKTNPPPEKARDSLAWTQHMNALKSQAEEMVLAEVVYR